MKQLIVCEELDAQGQIRVKGKDYKYLIVVLRKKIQDSVEVSCGSHLFRMKIVAIHSDKKEIILQQEKEIVPQIQQKGQLLLLQWVIKGNKMDAIIRQATEAGVAHIIPVLGEFSVIKKENEVQTERRKRIIREARQQSGSPIDTQIYSAQVLNDALKTLSLVTKESPLTKLVFSEKGAKTKTLHEGLHKARDRLVLAIGAEGGISSLERTLLYQEGFEEIHFLTNILRAETAALYAIAAVQTIQNEEAVWQLRE